MILVTSLFNRLEYQPGFWQSTWPVLPSRGPRIRVLWTELQLSQQPKDQIERCIHLGERFPKVNANSIVPCGRPRAL